MPHRDELVSTEELHKLTGFSKRFWEARRISGNTPPFLRVSGRAVRYRWGDVEQWLNTMKRNKTSDQGDNAQGNCMGFTPDYHSLHAINEANGLVECGFTEFLNATSSQLKDIDSKLESIMIPFFEMFDYFVIIAHTVFFKDGQSRYVGYMKINEKTKCEFFVNKELLPIKAKED